MVCNKELECISNSIKSISLFLISDKSLLKTAKLNLIADHCKVITTPRNIDTKWNDDAYD